MRVAPEIVLTKDERLELVELTTSGLTSVRLAQRAHIVLLAADGLQNQQIAGQWGIGRIPVRAGVGVMPSCDLPGSSVTCREERRRRKWNWRAWWN